MADWFKFYENDIDEMRMQWAISELPEVLSVWIVLLSEACRHKDGTLSGYCQDFELFAISKRINVSVPKVNQGIELLIKINYVERLENKTLIIRKWCEKQSDYCNKLTRLQNQSGGNHHTKRTKSKDSVLTVSGVCTDSVRQEESRGEESRRDKKEEGFESVIKYWNSKDLPKCQLISKIRGSHLNQRLKEKFFVDNWMTAIDKIVASEFCMGKNDRSWKADIDWFLRPDSVVKIMEGKYDNRKASKPSSSKHFPSSSELEAQYGK